MTTKQIRRGGVLIIVAATLLLSACAPLVHPAQPAPAPIAPIAPIAAQRSATVGVGSMPLAFEPNVGQAAGDARFVARSKQGAVEFRAGSIALGTHAAPIRIRFVGANASAQIVGGDPLPGVVNYYVGNDATQWKTNVPTFAGVTYRQLYPGIDLHYAGTGGQLKGTYEVQANADPAVIRWRYDGAREMRVDADGNLRVKAGDAELTEQAPVAWQTIEGKRVPVAARYLVANVANVANVADNEVRFALGAYDARYALTIDPTLLYSTLLGGNSADYGRDIALDAAGNMYVAGYSYSLHFPGSPATNAGSDDVVVTKINAQGNTLLWTTYMGGNQADEANGIALDGPGGTVWVTGYTLSSNFPTTSNAPQATSNGSYEAIVLRLNGATGAMVMSTYFGRTKASTSCQDRGNGIATDPNGNAYVTGETCANDIGNSGAVLINKYLATDNTNSDQMVMRDSYTTTVGNAIVVDPSGGIYVAGQIEHFGLGGFWVAKVKFVPANIQGVIWEKTVSGPNTGAKGVAVNASGEVFVTGFTSSISFPTTSGAAYATCPSGPNPDPSFTKWCRSSEAFAFKLKADGSDFVWSTYLGGDGWDQGAAIEVDSNDNAYIVGQTYSLDFPTKNAVQTQLGDGFCGVGGNLRRCYDAFVTKFTNGGTVAYSTYFGGLIDDVAYGAAIDAATNVYFTGYTRSIGSFPLKNAYQASWAGGDYEAYIAKIGDATAPEPTTTPDPKATPNPTSLKPRAYVPLMMRDYTAPASEPTTTPQPGATQTATPTPTQTPAPTATTGPVAGKIQGQVLYQGSGASGIELSLVRCDSTYAVCDTVATTQSNGTGQYQFTNPAMPPTGKVYFVYYENRDPADEKYLGTWRSFDIKDYTAGSTADGGTFEIADVKLLAPAYGVSVTLPIVFSWLTRGTSTDMYALTMADVSATGASLRCALSFVTGGNFVFLESNLSGCGVNPMSHGVQYGWYVYVAKGTWAGGFGVSHYLRTVTFTGTAAQASSSPALPAASSSEPIPMGDKHPNLNWFVVPELSGS